MPASTVQVKIEYQRAVRVGAEQALLRDILIDVGRLKTDTRFGNAYRSVYGDKSKINADELKKLLKAGDTVLVSEGEPASWADINKRALTPFQLCEILNSAAERKVDGITYPVDADGTVREYEPKDVLLDSNGQWPVVDKKTGRTAQSAIQSKAVLGTTPVQLTPDDLRKIASIQSDAAALGVKPEDLLYYYDLTVSDQTVAANGKVAVWWSGTDISDSTKLLKGIADSLRYSAPRPGGVNLMSNPYAPVDDAAAEPTSNTEYDAFPVNHRPEANKQKEDNYAVLRVVSGFTAATGDLLAPSATAGKFEVLFATNKFLLESVQESQSERISMVETFGETILYSFGERPKVYAYSGALMDTVGLNWLNEWREAYRTKFRASAMLKLKARAFLIYRDVCREGIIIANMNTLNVAEMGMGRFSFQMFVLKEYFLGNRPKIDEQIGAASGLDQVEPIDPEETQYVLGSIRDTTVDGGVPKVGEDKSVIAKRMRAATEAETRIISRRRDEIEAEITKQAFPGGKYKQSSGFFEIKLSTGDVSSSTQAYNTRLRSEDWGNSEQSKLLEVL